MSKGPEANFWNTLRSNLPKNAFGTRIENKHGGGVPDVHMVWDGLPFWLELKTIKSNSVKVSPHQIAWHMAYYARGGLSFFLVKSLSSKDLILFGGEKGPELLQNGVDGTEGARFKNPAALFEGLRPILEAHYSAALRPRTPDTGPIRGLSFT